MLFLVQDMFQSSVDIHVHVDVGYQTNMLTILHVVICTYMYNCMSQYPHHNHHVHVYM